MAGEIKFDPGVESGKNVVKVVQEYAKPKPAPKTIEQIAEELYGSLNLGSSDKPMPKYEDLGNDPTKGPFGDDPRGHPSMVDVLQSDPDAAARVSTALGSPMPTPSLQGGQQQGQAVQPPPGMQVYSGGPKGAPGGSMTQHTVAPMDLPGERKFIEQGEADASDIAGLAGQIPAEQAEREQRVQGIMGDFQKGQDERIGGVMADQRKRFEDAQKVVTEKVQALQNFQPKSFFDRSPGRAIAAIIGMGLAGALQGMTNGRAGGDVMQMISKTISDDARQQWEAVQAGVGQAHKNLVDQLGLMHNETEFIKTQEAAHWGAVAKQVESILKQPLPSELKQRGLVLAELARSRYGKIVQDLNHAQAGKVESWQKIQLMAKQTVAQGGGADPSKDPYSRLDPRAKSRVDQELRWYLGKLDDAGVPGMREPLASLVQQVNTPDAEKHINTVASALAQPGGMQPGPGGIPIGLAALNKYDPGAARFYQNLLNTTNAYLLARSGKQVTESEAVRLFKAAVGSGDYNGIRRGLAAIQQELSAKADHYAVQLSPEAAATVAWREAAGGLGELHPREYSSQGGNINPSAAQYKQGPAPVKSLEKPTEGRPLLKNEGKTVQ